MFAGGFKVITGHEFILPRFPTLNQAPGNYNSNRRLPDNYAGGMTLAARVIFQSSYASSLSQNDRSEWLVRVDAILILIPSNKVTREAPKEVRVSINPLELLAAARLFLAIMDSLHMTKMKKLFL